jgi:hypothetical protein
MPRELTAAEKAAFLDRHEEFLNLSGSETLPEDGVIVGDDLGCVFLFDKQDGYRIFALVSDIWPDCVRQTLPPPPSILDELLLFVSEFRSRTEKLLIAAAWTLAIILVIQSGILKGVFAKA